MHFEFIMSDVPPVGQLDAYLQLQLSIESPSFAYAGKSSVQKLRPQIKLLAVLALASISTTTWKNCTDSFSCWQRPLLKRKVTSIGVWHFFWRTCLTYVIWTTEFGNTRAGCFPVLRFYYVRLRTHNQYASMNEFTCSEHGVRLTCPRSWTAVTWNKVSNAGRGLFSLM